jgi:hypothetical protein
MRLVSSGMWAVPHSVLVLGFAGALPFVVAALLAFAGPPSSARAVQSLLVYGAVILSFLGGVQWGLTMASGQLSIARLGISVVPALIAWPAALLGGPLGLLLLAAAFAGVLAYDLRTVREGRAPAWYPALRWPLTLVVVACLLLGAVAAGGWG